MFLGIDEKMAADILIWTFVALGVLALAILAWPDPPAPQE